MSGRRQLLVVDDSATIRKLVELSFGASEWTAEFAATGTDAIASIRRRVPDAVLLDFVLPDMRAPEVCRALTAVPSIERAAVVVMSGKRDTIRGLFREFSFVVDFLAKPFAAADVVSRIRDAAQRVATSAPALDAGRSTVPTTRIAAQTDADADFSGQLGKLTLPSLLEAIAGEHEHGTLTLSEGGQRLTVYLHGGEWCLVLADPPRRESLSHLGSQISDELWQRAEAEQLAGARPVFLTLVEAGVLHRSELSGSLAEQSEALLLDAVQRLRPWAFSFRANVPPEHVCAFGSPLNLPSLKLAAFRAAPPAHAGEALLATPEAAFRRAPGFSRSIKHFALDETERRLLAHAGTDLALSKLASRIGASLQVTAAALHRLRAVGLMTLAAPSTLAKPPSVAILAQDREGFGEPLRDFLRERGALAWIVPEHSHAGALASLRRDKPTTLLVSGDQDMAVGAATTVRSDPDLRELRLVAVTDSSWLDEDDGLSLAGYEEVLRLPVPEVELERILRLEHATGTTEIHANGDNLDRR